MNKRWVIGLFAVVSLAACNRTSQVTIQAVSSAGGVASAHAQLEIRMLPYDRDAVFAQLIAAASDPEPQPPEDLLLLRDSIAAAQDSWRQAEASWNNTYSELKDLSDRMEGMNSASDAYFEAYQRFDDLDGQERRLNRDRQRYFDEFDALQKQYSTRADSFSAVVTTWEDETFMNLPEVIDSLLEAGGREVLFDTTDAAGIAQFIVPRGKWYIHTRAKLPFEELYWNVPVEIAGGTADTIVIDATNAQVRPVF